MSILSETSEAQRSAYAPRQPFNFETDVPLGLRRYLAYGTKLTAHAVWSAARAQWHVVSLVDEIGNDWVMRMGVDDRVELDSTACFKGGVVFRNE